MTDIIKFKLLKKRYCLKKIEIPLTCKEIISQHKFINYLNKKGFNTPKVYGKILMSRLKLEIQQYINNSNNIFDIYELVCFIASFHNYSSNYTKKLYKKNTYKVNYYCNGILINELLLSFKDKYYIGPINNYYSNKRYINEKQKVINRVILKHKKMFKYFYKNYYNENCIIHNDITSNNILQCNNNFYMIDFDLCIKGSIYVDFVDVLIKRKTTIKQITELINDDNFIDEYVSLYNSKSNFKICKDGVLLMLAIKIFAYNFFVLLHKNSIKIFEKNIEEIYLLQKTIERKLPYDL